MRGPRLLAILLVVAAACAPARAGRAQSTGSSSGLDGAWRVVAATAPEKGTVRVVASGEWLQEHGYITAGHSHERTATATAIAWAPAGWLELSAAMLGQTNHDSATDPLFIAAWGDADLGARIATTIAGGESTRLSAGVRGGVKLLQGDRAGDIIGNAASPYGFGLLSLEHGTWRLSLDGGYLQDNSKHLLDPRLTPDAGQAYAYGIDRYNAVLGGVALDFPGARFAPLLEVTARDDLGGKGTPATVATLGARWAPGRGRLALTGALDVGLAGTEVEPGRLRAPNWNLVGGLAIRFGRGGGRGGVLRRRREIEPVPDFSRFPPGTGLLRGHVIDADSGAPLDGVTILLADGTTAVTDSSGHFAFAPIRHGPVKLAVRHDEYEGKGKTAFVSVRQATTLVFRMTRIPPPPEGSARLIGSVIDAEGRFVAATIVATEARQKETRIETDPDGKFRLELPVGAYALAVSAPGFETKNELGMLDANQEAPVTVVLTRNAAADARVADGASASAGESDAGVPRRPSAAKRTGVLSGTVTGRGGRPVRAALIAIHAGGSTQQLTTDAKGRYRAEVAAGEIKIAVSAIGYATRTFRGKIGASQQLRFDVKLLRPGAKHR